nr:PREDICTED: putative nuclease HARBI1 [Latimeria chalumnae]|eukprot:XP_014354468.1 PREDICTED: putative nuclease HARBI1 [Latimeria chalumnae]
MLQHIASYFASPITEQERKTISQDFYYCLGMPCIMGPIACTCVSFVALLVDAVLNINCKMFHGLNMQVVCDFYGLILDVVVKFSWSSHYTYIWSQSGLNGDLKSVLLGSGHLVSGSAYPLQAYFLTPYMIPRTPPEVAYNVAHAKAWNIMEHCFEQLKMQFKCLDYSGGALPLLLEKVCKVFVVCCMLNNLVKRKNIPLLEDIKEDVEASVEEPGQATRRHLCVEEVTGYQTRERIA